MPNTCQKLFCVLVFFVNYLTYKNKKALLNNCYLNRDKTKNKHYEQILV